MAEAMFGLRRRLPSAMLLALALHGCATSGETPPEPQRPPPSSDERAGAMRVLDWYQGMRELDATELAKVRRQYADKASSAEVQLRQALLAAHPQANNLPRARSLLENLLANQGAEARALHPFAQLLLEQIGERQRLDAAAQRLGQQLERGSQQLKDAQQLNVELQGKLDALAEIERSLPARPATSTQPAPAVERSAP
ncbi:hypothetical protein CJ010_17430 [Azoarcus sp. DD4]|uniref:hypothetical protein n=1 Tax=Azoarcus sp. DD4 TaxID=2027405 RepID=UPI0011264B1E|nr:hypothetical protein [Azoarcus sp. DD4]QDF98194.1 hypothetical protein CJ010_17430 [Azoarcus sp. DD4]